jgi:nitroreductase
MVRSFEDRPLGPGMLEELLDAALRAPSAGFTQGVELVVLEGPEQTRAFWEATTTEEWRSRASLGEGLMRAPVVILPLSGSRAYLERYAEPDKARSGLASLPESGWPVPYWTVDAAFSAMLVLLRAVDLGLGALFFRIFTGEEGLLRSLGVPPGFRPIGAIAVGHPARDSPSRPPARRRRPRSDLVHRGRW